MLERPGFARLDPLLLFAGIGMIAFSAYTLGVATQEDSPATPTTTRSARRSTPWSGSALMLAVARVDYSRFRELRVGIYTAMVPRSRSSSSSPRSPAGPARWIELPFFRFQPSELGKVLLIVALAAFALDTSRRSSDARRTLRLLVLGLLPGGPGAACSPTSGRHWSTAR